MKKMIMIEVSAREANVLTHYAMKSAANHVRESNGWKAAVNALNEASKAVYFPVEGSDEENELKQQGVEIKRGMAFMEPESALQMMQSMAQDNSAFKDVPTITSLIRKIAARLGMKMPKIASGKGEEGAGYPPVDSMGSGVEGAEKAKYAETQPLPDLQSQEEFERMQQNMYAPTSTAHGLTPQVPEEDVPELTPLPGTHQIFQPRVRKPQEMPGEDVDVSNWASEVDKPKAGTVGSNPQLTAFDFAQMSKNGAVNPKDLKLKKTGNLINQQAVERNPEENLSNFADEIDEAYRLLGIRKPVWRNRNV